MMEENPYTSPKNAEPALPLARPAHGVQRIARHPIFHATSLIAAGVSAYYAWSALWLWNHEDQVLSPSDPGIGLLIAVFSNLVLAWLAALAACVLGIVGWKRLFLPVRCLAFAPLIALAIDFVAGRHLGYR